MLPSRLEAKQSYVSLYTPRSTVPPTFTVHTSWVVLPAVTYCHGNGCSGMSLVTLLISQERQRGKETADGERAEQGAEELKNSPGSGCVVAINAVIATKE